MTDMATRSSNTDLEGTEPFDGTDCSNSTIRIPIRIKYRNIAHSYNSKIAHFDRIPVQKKSVTFIYSNTSWCPVSISVIIPNWNLLSLNKYFSTFLVA